MTPNYDKAAITAMETLIKYNITSAPIYPLPILKNLPGVLVLSYAEISNTSGIDRNHLVMMFGKENQDAVTSVIKDGNRLLYLVTFNQRLPIYLVQRALARELGHILLKHDGSLPEDVRYAEAMCFAHHFLCPRPVIHAIQQSDIPFTAEILGNMTGCYERCLLSMKKMPAVHVPAELNQKVRNQFSDYLSNFLSFQNILSKNDESSLADFGTYMDSYEE